jgi:hypothetical protein
MEQPTQTAMSVTEMRIPILSSRFSTDTWGENDAYRAQRNSTGCIYGCPLRISSKVHINAFAYVLEMNNSTNRIEGVGVIRNYPNVDQPPWIYANNNYNRYIYEGEYRMDRDAIARYDVNLVDSIEIVCFKGKTHLKRGSGLTLVPEKLLLLRHDTDNPDTNIARELQTVFRSHFRGAVDNSDPGITRTV